MTSRARAMGNGELCTSACGALRTCLAAATITFATAVASAETITVCHDGSGDYRTIQEGIDAASEGDEVVVCDGIYTGNGNRNLNLVGKLITVRSQNGPEHCTIDCQASPFDPHRGFTFISGETANAIVDGFTVMNGFSTGGAVYIHASNPTLTNCCFRANAAPDFGAGVYNGAGDPTLVNCAFIANTDTPDGGGGMYSRDGNPTLINCTFSENSRPDDSYGGGMYSRDGSPSLVDCTFNGNSAHRGGALYIRGGAPTLIHCTFNENTGHFGGGIYYRDSDPTLTNCTFRNNSGGSGGAMSGENSNPTLTNCTFVRNSANGGAGVFQAGGYQTLVNCTFDRQAAETGAGMHVGGCFTTLVNCSFTENSCERGGGGIYNLDGEVTLTNCTFWHNSAGVAGIGGVGGALSSFFSVPTLTNCIIWGNSASIGAQIYQGATVNYSCIQGGWAGVGNIDADPRFVDPDHGDFRLDRASPCIDAADNLAVPPDSADLDGDGDRAERTPLDLAGRPRFADDPFADDTGRADPPDYPDVVDMGALEFQPCLGDLDRDDRVDLADLAILLSNYGQSDMGPADGDITGDSRVDLDDLTILLDNYGIECG